MYHNRAGQLVGSKLNSSGDTHMALFFVFFNIAFSSSSSSPSSALPYIMTVTKYLIEAFNDLSRATVPFLQSSFYI